MFKFQTLILIMLCILSSHDSSAQEDIGPVMIKINRIAFTQGNQYTFYIPTFKFHMFFQKSFNILRSAVTADYDYQRQDMGFGMSHSFINYVVNPGISVDDDIYFRKVFSDSTGIWRRKQSITPFLMHELNNNSSIGIEFKIEREWSPKRRMGSEIISNQDRSVRAYYVYHNGERSTWKNQLFYFSFERSYKIFKGKFNYFLIEILTKYSKEITNAVYYKGIFNYRGNATPQESPIFFIGGHSTVIGYENDEFWGKRYFYFKNRLELRPFPEFRFSVKKAQFERLSLLYQIDFGQVKGAAHFKDMKPQTKDIKIGVGIGIGVYTKLPFMPSTNVHFLFSAPSEDISDIKYYTGFGGWIN